MMSSHRPAPPSQPTHAGIPCARAPAVVDSHAACRFRRCLVATATSTRSLCLAPERFGRTGGLQTEAGVPVSDDAGSGSRQTPDRKRAA